MQPYDLRLKAPSRQLRRDMTDAEQRLWFRVCRKQIVGVQFYRQKPLLGYVVDFFAPAAGLVIEIDGGPHFDAAGLKADAQRDAALLAIGLRVLRFDNLQVLRATDAVAEIIHGVVAERLGLR